MDKKVVVTGIGVISALGRGTEPLVSALKSGVSGIEKISFLDTEHRHLPAGEVKLSNQELASLLQVNGPEAQLRTVLLGISAARDAIADANLSTHDVEAAAFINGTTVGGMDYTEKFFKEVFESEASSPATSELKYNDCGTSTDLIADNIGNPAMVTTSSTACSSAANAIILGADMIKSGITRFAIAGGAEALSKFHFNGFNTLMILDSQRCRPFDADRAGINLGEGAAYLVLESEESARERGVKPLAVLRGYGNACDAFHQTATSDNGEGPFLSMSKALEMACIKPEDVDYINAHGTGTPNNDICEYAAMERIWGDKIPAFSSTKPFTGHTTSASGSIESVIAILLFREHFLPANLGFKSPMKESAFPVVNCVEKTDIRNIVNNSFGFGGNDSTLIFGNPKFI